jgi:hypothetical protein
MARHIDRRHIGPLSATTIIQLLAAATAFAMANVQAALRISTLLYLVPVPFAAAHQAGSVALLTATIHALLSLHRSGAAARAWQQANLARRGAGATTMGGKGQNINV